MIIGATLGVIIGIVGILVPWLLPNIFTSDLNVIQEVSSHVFDVYKSAYLLLPDSFGLSFSSCLAVSLQMHRVLVLFFFALAITPCTHSLEGTLLVCLDDLTIPFLN